MNKLYARILGAFVMLPVLASAQSTLDGTWKIDLNQAQLTKKPDVYLLHAGIYECKTCVPPLRVDADGVGHAVTGHRYFDSISVKVVDEHSIAITESRSGSVVSTEKTTVADDGTTAKTEFSDRTATNAAPVTGATEMTRVAKGPAGSHAISGSWRTTRYANVSDNGLTFTYKTEGDVLNMTTPTGQSFSATMDGKFVAYNGDPGTSSVSIHRIDKHTFQETDRNGTKTVSVTRMSVAADGATMKMLVHDTLHGTSMTLVAAKQ
jgi:hypothetical protein